VALASRYQGVTLLRLRAQGFTGLPRGASLFDMHFAMKLLRAAPVSF
jgi:hypothetical protein